MTETYYTLITGASEGFGKALSLECASRKMNLVLVALPQSGLQNLARYIERSYNVSVHYFEFDLSLRENCHRLFAEIRSRSLALNILINNAGIGGTHLFEERDPDFYDRQIRLNIVAPTILTYFFLEQHQPGPDAYILNVSSMAGFFYLPRKQVYGGTKSYLVSFTRSLRKELESKQIYVGAVCPGGMNTTPIIILQNKKGNALSRWSIMNPEDVAKITVDQMFRKKEIIIPGAWNRAFIMLDRFIPALIKNSITRNLFRKQNAAPTLAKNAGKKDPGSHLAA